MECEGLVSLDGKLRARKFVVLGKLKRVDVIMLQGTKAKVNLLLRDFKNSDHIFTSTTATSHSGGVAALIRKSPCDEGAVPTVAIRTQRDLAQDAGVFVAAQVDLYQSRRLEDVFVREVLRRQVL